MNFQPDSGKNGAVTYTKIAGNGFNYFSIENTTGLVTTTAAIDCETFQVSKDGWLFGKSSGRLHFNSLKYITLTFRLFEN